MSRAQVHRFRDSVAAFLGDGQTVYMTPADARRIARALNAAAREIASGVPFAQSSVGTVQIELKPARPEPPRRYTP